MPGVLAVGGPLGRDEEGPGASECGVGPGGDDMIKVGVVALVSQAVDGVVLY